LGKDRAHVYAAALIMMRLWHVSTFVGPLLLLTLNKHGLVEKERAGKKNG